MNLADPELELLDPTPNVNNLFIQFDRVFFWSKLANKAVVRWGKTMYWYAGTCSYEGKGGRCDIVLSEPLLKLRPRKDLVQILLHEMIHAYLFITRQEQIDEHDSKFQDHMHRINKLTGLNISIYHQFQKEMNLYQAELCNDSCRKIEPFLGIVQSTQNRSPSPNECSLDTHNRDCGDTSQKITEPDNHTNKAINEENTKNNGDVTKSVTDKTVSLINTDIDIKKMNANSIIDDRKKPIIISNVVEKNDIGTSKSDSVNETCRPALANRELSNSNNTLSKSKSIDSNIQKPTKSKASDIHSDSPPSKQIKLDSFSKNEDSNKKIIAVNIKLMDCPICSQKVDEKIINTHLDECSNKDIVEIIKDNFQVLPEENNITPTSLDVATTSNANAITSPLYKKQNIIDDSDDCMIVDVKMTDNDNFNANTLNKDTKSNNSANTRRSDNFLVSNGASDKRTVSILDDMGMKPQIKSEPVSSKDTKSILLERICPDCGERIIEPVPDNNSTTPNQGKKPIIISDVVKKNDIGTSKSDSVSKSKSIDSNIHKPTKSKASDVHSDSPPSKQIKLDSFSKNQDANNKIIAVNIKLMDCPICSQKVDEKIINTHLDECSNKDIVEIIKDNFQVLPEENNITPTSLDVTTTSNVNAETSPLSPQNIIDDSDDCMIVDIKKEIKMTDNDNFNANTLNKDTKSNNSANTRRSDNFLVSNGASDKRTVSILDDMGMKPQIKSEPVSSKDTKPISLERICPDCGERIIEPVPDNNSTTPNQGKKPIIISDVVRKNDIGTSKSDSVSKSKSIDSNIHKPTKSKASDVHSDSPPSKQIKLDSFSKNQDANNKIIAVNIKLMDCPICSQKVDEKIINTHLDECSNKDIVEIIKDNFQVLPEENNITPTSLDVTTTSNANAETSPLSPQNIIDDSDDCMIVDIKKEIKMTDNDNFNANTLNKDTKSNNSANTRRSDNFLVSNGASDKRTVSILDDMGMKPQIKSEPVSSKDTKPISLERICPDCGRTIIKPVPDNNRTTPNRGASTSIITTIVIDDDDDDDDDDENDRYWLI